MDQPVTERTKLLSENPYEGSEESELISGHISSEGNNLSAASDGLVNGGSGNLTSSKTYGHDGKKHAISKNYSAKASGAKDKRKKALAHDLGPRMKPQRTSKNSQKLKLLPEALDYESGEDDVRQMSLKKIKDMPARKDAERLGRKERNILPRVTAYCTAGAYRMRDLIRWLQDKKRIHSTAPKLFDECIYTPFAYKDWRHKSRSWDMLQNYRNPSYGMSEESETNFIRLDAEGGDIKVGKLSTGVFIFEYGVVVMWGFNKKEEQAFLDDLARFESDKLSNENVQMEEFNYYVTRSYQPRIYNDFISLRDDANYMTKLSISYAISQSVKISLFEELVDNTIEDTQDIPEQISKTGKVEMTKDEIMKSIGELFILRININLHGAILDSPELMWSEPQLEPIYQATRGYLEINQRVTLLNQRLEVISDLLQMLKEQLTHNDDEQIEMIVILLIAAEVFVSMINIIVDLIAERK